MKAMHTFAALGALLLAAVCAAGPAEPAPEKSGAAKAVASVEGITEYRLDNGLRFLLFPDQSKQQITVNITYLVGSRHEGYGETGMAHLLEHLVFKGSTDHPRIDDELSERGAFANGTTWFDRTNYYETFPASEDNLDWALDLESDRMVNSFIAAEDLESEMTVVRNEWEAGENNPQSVLVERVMSTAYLWHNYGNSTIGARADIENVPLERLRAFYRKYYQPDNAVLVVSGRFDPERAVDMVAEHFGAIPRPERTGANTLFETYTAEPPQDGERSVTLRRVGDVQLAMAAYHIPAGSDARFAAVDVLANLLRTEPAGRLYRSLVAPGLAASSTALALQLGEPGPAAGAGRSAQGRQSRRRCRGAARRRPRRGGRTPDRGGGEPRQDPVRGRLRPRLQQSPGHRLAAERVGGDGRLAAAVSASGPHRRGDAGRRAAGGARLSASRQPHPRLLPSHGRNAAAGGDSRAAGRGRLGGPTTEAAKP